jgi:hypothetical protein
VDFPLAAEVVAALRSTSGREAIADAAEPMVERVLRRVLAELQERLEPLHAIREVKPDTARKMIKRDAALAALAVTTRGRTLLFKRSAVLAYLAEKGGAK